MTLQLQLLLQLQHLPSSRSAILCPALLALDLAASQALVACPASLLTRLPGPVARTATEAASLKVSPTESLWRTSLWMIRFVDLWTQRKPCIDRTRSSVSACWGKYALWQYIPLTPSLLSDPGEDDLASCNLERHLYFFLSFVSPFELELFTACLLGMHAYIPCPFCCATSEGVVHMPFALPLLLLLCFPSYVPDAFPLLPSWCYPLGVCILLILSRAYEFLSVLCVLCIALFSDGVVLWNIRGIQ